MKALVLVVLIFSQISFGHEAHHHHGDELTAQSPLPETSILQLGSEWKNQKGQSVKLSNLQGSPRLVVMLFTRCETACPLIVEDLKALTKQLKEKQKEKIKVSFFSLDSFRETPESLATFSAKRKLPQDWELYTSNADAVSELAAALGVRYKRLPNGDYIHSNVIYLLNANGEIIAQKDGIKSPGAEFVKQMKSAL
jgi:protein SCO1/2